MEDTLTDLLNAYLQTPDASPLPFSPDSASQRALARGRGRETSSFLSGITSFIRIIQSLSLSIRHAISSLWPKRERSRGMKTLNLFWYVSIPRRIDDISVVVRALNYYVDYQWLIYYKPWRRWPQTAYPCWPCPFCNNSCNWVSW